MARYKPIHTGLKLLPIGNWRFTFKDGQAYVLDYEDCH
jgi:hypothetical protein